MSSDMTLKAKKGNGKLGNGPKTLIFVAFAMLIIAPIFVLMVSLSDPPDQADFSQAGYQEALDDHDNTMEVLAGLGTLFTTSGVFMLGAGLFFYSIEASEDLPVWVRTALMAGTMYFLVRMATSNLSLTDMMLISIL